MKRTVQFILVVLVIYLRLVSSHNTALASGLVMCRLLALVGALLRFLLAKGTHRTEEEHEERHTVMDLKTKEEHKEEKHIVMELTEADIDKIDIIEMLGEGGFGKVEKVIFKDEQMVMKTILENEDLETLFLEVEVLKELDGAGGAPILHAVCSNPPSMITSFAGMDYEEYLQECTDKDILESLVKIAQKLDEIHKKNRLHNDIKGNNITVSFHDVDEEEMTLTYWRRVEFHFIDFGMSTKMGDHQPQDCEGLNWMSPEQQKGQPLTPASDVYSLGCLLSTVLTYIGRQRISERLSQIQEESTSKDPLKRPDLETLTTQFEELLLDM